MGTAGRQGSAWMAGPLFPSASQSLLLYSRIAVFTTRQLLSPKCGSTVARPSQGLGSELAYFLLCHILFIKMSHKASPDALWEGRLYKAMNTGRHGSLAGVFGNQLLH